MKTHARGQDWQGSRTRCGITSNPRVPLSMVRDDELPTCQQCIRGGLADMRIGELSSIHPSYRKSGR
jgi:hypothetical protein